MVWRCENTSCPARIRRSLEHFASAVGDEHRRARRVAGRSADRAGPGPRLRRPLPARGRAARDSWSSRRASRGRSGRVPRKLGKVGRNVIEQIERSKANDLSRLIYALGIRHVGEKAAATLARQFRTMDRACSRRRSRRCSRSPRSARSSRRRCARSPTSRATATLVDRLAAGGRQHDEPGARADATQPGPLAGKVFVLTGTLASMTREEAHRGARSGWARRVTGSVSKKTTYLSSPAPRRAASSRKPRQLGVETLDEAGVSGCL